MECVLWLLGLIFVLLGVCCCVDGVPGLERLGGTFSRGEAGKARACMKLHMVLALFCMMAGGII